MKDYVLVSDSTADMPRELVKELGINIVPFSYSIDNEIYQYYLDERDGDIKVFYDKLREGAMPVTSQINPAMYKEFFEQFIKDGKDIVYMSFTSGLSGSYQTSKLAIEMLKDEYEEANIIAVDSLSASIGQGIFLYHAALLKNEGYTMEELVEWIEKSKHQVNHWFMVEDLFHLKRGGRVSAVEAVVGSALKIKPILSVDEEGKLVVKSKARGSGKALDYIKERVISEGGDLASLKAIIGSADAEESALKLKDMVTNAGMKEENIFIADIGPIIGSHVGAGMVAIAFIGR